MPTDHDPDPAGLGPPDVEDLLDLWDWVRGYRAAAVERERALAMMNAHMRPADPHLAERLDHVARLAAEERAEIDAALKRYLGRSDPPWAIWERAFGWRPGNGQVRAFLHRAQEQGLDTFPLGARDEERRHVLGVAVEHVYRHLDGRQSQVQAVVWTQLAAVLHGVEEAAPHADGRDHETWCATYEDVLDSEDVRECLGETAGGPPRRGPKIAACKVVWKLVGPSWRTCEDAHKAAVATMAEWRSTAR